MPVVPAADGQPFLPPLDFLPALADFSADALFALQYFAVPRDTMHPRTGSGGMPPEEACLSPPLSFLDAFDFLAPLAFFDDFLSALTAASAGDEKVEIGAETVNKNAAANAACANLFNMSM